MEVLGSTALQVSIYTNIYFTQSQEGLRLGFHKVGNELCMHIEVGTQHPYMDD